MDYKSIKKMMLEKEVGYLQVRRVLLDRLKDRCKKNNNSLWIYQKLLIVRCGVWERIYEIEDQLIEKF